MRRNAGLTVIDTVIVCFILGAVVVLLVPDIIPRGDRCRSKHSASQATIQDFSVALKAYETDFGDYPEDEPGFYITRRGPLVALMTSNGPKNIPYYQFRADSFNAKGQWVTALGTPFKYRKNAGKLKPVAPSPLTMMNFFSFDMWAAGCGDAPACSPETSEPADKANIKNW